MNELQLPLRVPALRVKQNLGVFYVASISAKLLCNVAFSVKAQYLNESLKGTQRKITEERTSLISEYINSPRCTFPNSIILGANFDSDGEFIDDDHIRWSVGNTNNKGIKEYHLLIPSIEKAASIIDGQHRLEGFKKYFNSHEDAEDMNLLCSIYFDIPASVQAEIFATINYNQKPVDKSLAYQLFGYSLDEKSSDEWEPDNLALYISRILDSEESSPLYGMIKSGAEEGEIERRSRAEFHISTAAAVQGIASLFSSNQVKDRYKINEKSIFKKGRAKLKGTRSSAPLREQYIEGNDRVIYDIIFNFFSAAMDTLILPSKPMSKMRSTIGVMALFDILKHVLTCQDSLKASKEYFLHVLERSASIDFEDYYFSAAGVGKGRIKNALLLTLNIDSKHHDKVVSRIKDDAKRELSKLVP